MPIEPGILAVFGYFQNLNLLALLEDLRTGRAARRYWFNGENLCPVAHGLPAGNHVDKLSAPGPNDVLEYVRCDYAARYLSADPKAVLHFVRAWDEGGLSADWLLAQLQELWEERLADAVAVQALLQGKSVIQEAPEEIAGRA